MSEIKEQIAKLMAKSPTGLRFDDIRREGIAIESLVRYELKEMETCGYVKRTGANATTRYELTISGRMMFVIGNDDNEKSPEKSSIDTTGTSLITEECTLESDRINPIQESALHDFEKHLDVVSDEADPTPVTSDKIENIIIKDLNPKNFVIRKAVDDAAAIIISHYESQITPPRVIDNIETKIALLSDMAEQSNSQRANVIKMIILDLQS